MQQLLRELCSYFDADFSYIAEVDETGDFITITYGYGIFDDKLPEIGHTLPFDDSVYWVRALKKDGYLSIADAEKLEDVHAEAKVAIEAKTLHSIAAVALKQNNEVIGSAYIVNPRMNQSHLPHLSAIGDCVSVVLQRLRLHNQVKEENMRMLSVIDNLPVGFMQVKLPASSKDSPEILLISETLCNLLMHPREELLTYTPQTHLSLVHPDDITQLEQDMARIRIEERFSSHYRILRGDGQFIPLSIQFFTITHADESYTVNLYYQLDAE